MLLACHNLDLGGVLMGCRRRFDIGFLSTGLSVVRISHDKPHICILEAELACGKLDWLLHHPITLYIRLLLL